MQAYLDKAGQMRMVGDLAKYTQFQAAEAIGSAAKNEGGVAGAGAGIGAGVAIGQAMANAFSQNAAGGANPAAAAKSAQESQDAVAMLGKLHELLTKGVITQAEFDAKKAELLKKIT